MSRRDLFEKMGGLGRRTSGFEKGKTRRGLLGRGAKDIAAFGTVHFESIRDDEYNHLTIPRSLKCRFDGAKPRKADKTIRSRLGVPRGINGTVVTFEVERQFNVPQHSTLLADFSRYYSLRDIFSSPGRSVVLVDRSQGREDPLIYKYPEGQVVFDKDITVPGYAGATAHLTIREHETSIRASPFAVPRRHLDQERRYYTRLHVFQPRVRAARMAIHRVTRVRLY